MTEDITADSLDTNQVTADSLSTDQIQGKGLAQVYFPLGLRADGDVKVEELRATTIDKWPGLTDPPNFPSGAMTDSADGFRSNNYKTRDNVGMMSSDGSKITMWQDVHVDHLQSRTTG